MRPSHPSILIAGLPLLLASFAAAQPAGFPTRQGILDRMTAAANNFPSICQLVDLTARYGLPKTVGGNSLYAVKISDNVGQEEDEPSFLMVASHHANEYGTPIVALEAIDSFTQGYGIDARVTRLVDSQEIWIAPLWNPDGYFNSRKNGRGVDLNRNYPFLWSSPCSGSTSTFSQTYKGAAPGSEIETQTMMAFSEDQRFAKVLDFHSSGRETLYGYRCTTHRLLNYLQSEAVRLSRNSGYNGQVRPPSAEGEHYHWQLGTYSNYAFLTEISNTQSPSISSALSEASRVWPGTLWMLDRPIPISGHITDAVTGAPLSASLSYVEAPFTQGERNTSEPLFGRYHAFVPAGSWTLRVQSEGYRTRDVQVQVGEGPRVVDIALVPDAVCNAAQAVTRNGTGVNPVCLSSNVPVFGGTWSLTVDPSFVSGAVAVGYVATALGTTGPLLPDGEILVDPASPFLFGLGLPVAGGPVTLDVQLPGTAGLAGFSGVVQGLIVGPGGGARFCNAIDFVVGCP